MIMTSLFVRITAKSEKTNTVAKVITIGFLAGIVFIVVGLVIWVITLIVENLGSGSAETNFFEALMNLSGGLSLFTYGLIAFFVTILILIFMTTSVSLALKGPIQMY